jgi:hypothetical protein
MTKDGSLTHMQCSVQILHWGHGFEDGKRLSNTWRSHLQWYSVCDLQKYFSHPSSVIYFLPTPPTKLKLGLQIGVRVLIVFHLDQSIYIPNWQQVLGFAVPATSLSKLCRNVGPKPFCWAKLACFNFSLSNFNLQGHILSTCGVALSNARSHTQLGQSITKTSY